MAISRGQSMLDTSHGLLIIPGREGDVKIGVESLFSTPLYWSAPDIFLGDKILAYNGYLRYGAAFPSPPSYVVCGLDCGTFSHPHFQVFSQE